MEAWQGELKDQYKFCLDGRSRLELHCRKFWGSALSLLEGKELVDALQNPKDEESLRAIGRIFLKTTPGAKAPEGWYYDGSVARRFFEEKVAPSAFMSKAKEYADHYNALIAELVQKAAAVGLKLCSSKECRSGEAEIFKESFVRSFAKKMEAAYKSAPYRSSDIEEDIAAACSVAALARELKLRKACEGVPNSEGVFAVEEMASPFMNPAGDIVPQSIVIESQRPIILLNGPQMSGKTYFEKEVCATLSMLIHTGHAFAKKAFFPFSDRILYFDRVASKEDANLSAAGQEYIRFDKFTKLLLAAKCPFAAIDELGSSMPANYRAALCYSALSLLAGSGATAFMSLHDHRFIKEMKERNELLRLVHFAYRIEDGRLHFDRTPKEGAARSEALIMAKMLGVPEEILSRARYWLSKIAPHLVLGGQD